ncbi:hypothetical protein, partial [Azohydromonas aeria]|uniref:hypothetical protein n=1 Tax=Azohydromonas aeria TaxID=2590212 RepID=UPI0035C2122A
PRAAPGWSALLPAALALLLGGVLAAADDAASPRPPARASAVLPADARPTLDFALADWLLGLCHPDPGGRAAGGACRPALAPDAQGGLRVTLVAAEGAGMGGAAWTAFALQQLAQRDPALPRRTFAVTGVSGAALGAALLRGCTAEGRIDEDCLERLARADLVSPLLSAGLFEDVLAALLPTRWCTLPGCGFLTRAAWFEQALESGAPALRQGLMASRLRQLEAAPGGTHVPWLLLQARWADSGERAIASDLRIDWRQFPGARDQLGLTGRDLPLGTAAHNAARVPLLHPAGALQAPRARCLERGDEARTPGQRLDASPLQTCGHLDDGALADPGATQTTLDLLHALGRCLAAAPSAADRALFPRCAALDGAQRAWLREHLVPQVLVLRPAVPAQPGEDWCPALDQRPPTAAELALQQPQAGCASPERAPRVAERPSCPARDGAAWFEALLPAGVPSPAQSAAAALAEARLAQGAAALRASLGSAAQASAEPPVRTLELLPDGTRWARSWQLSALGVERMWRQARGCVGQVQGRDGG